MVWKLCTLFESSSKKALESESQSESKARWDSSTTMTTPFRLSETKERIVVHMILKGFRVWVDERDVSMDLAYREELQRALGESHVVLPQVFVQGKYVGGAKVIKHLFETGKLAKIILESFPNLKPDFVCEHCGDARFVPCENCCS